MKTMMIATLMVLTATSAQAAVKDCAAASKNDSFKNLASSAQEIVAQFSADKRIVIDRKSKEYKALNAIGIVKIEGSKFYGTGFLVSPCHVLTNNHVAFENPKAAKNGALVKFSVGQTGSTKTPFQIDSIQGKVISHGQFDNTDATRSSDWVVVKLAKSVGNTVGYIPFLQVKDPNKLVNRPVETVGFPGNRTNGGHDFSKIYGDVTCKINETNALGYLDHTCQATGGQSGSPVLTKDSKGQYYAIGMISGNNGYNMEASEDPNKANMAVNFLSGVNAGKISDGDLIASAIAGDKCE